MSYDILFYSELASRKSCSKCPYANTTRPSDITLGDFWGFEKIKPEANEDNQGVSLIMCNTPMGEAYFEKARKAMDVFEVSTDDYLQPNLIQPTEAEPQRDEFEKYYVKHGFEKSMRHFKLMGWQRQLDLYKKRQIRRIVKYTKKILQLVKR